MKKPVSTTKLLSLKAKLLALPPEQLREIFDALGAVLVQAGIPPAERTSRKQSRPWEDSEIALMQEMIARGHTNAVIGKALHRHPGSVAAKRYGQRYRDLKQATGKATPPLIRWTAAEDDQLIEMLAEGKTVAQAAEALGRGAHATHFRLHTLRSRRPVWRVSPK